MKEIDKTIYICEMATWKNDSRKEHGNKTVSGRVEHISYGTIDSTSKQLT